MSSVQELLSELLPELGQVQALSNDWVCQGCMGPVNPGWQLCHGCDRLKHAGTPEALLDRVIPVSIAKRPGPWYNRLARYKAGYPGYRAHLAALAWTFVQEHEQNIAAVLGGEHTAIVPVPSKRGKTFHAHGLRQAISMVRPMGAILVDPLIFVPSSDVDDWRRSYYPHCFDPGPESVEGHRVLLIEDTWVTGATALSAAGALLRDGAESVIIVPLGRVLDLSFWEKGAHPYVEKVHGDAREDYEVARWPRGE